MLTLEQRVTEQEEKVARLSAQTAAEDKPLWEQWFGAFKDDPTFDEVVRLGSEYRKSQPNAADAPDALEP